jgi:hypothetical protein
VSTMSCREPPATSSPTRHAVSLDLCWPGLWEWCRAEPAVRTDASLLTLPAPGHADTHSYFYTETPTDPIIVKVTQLVRSPDIRIPPFPVSELFPFVSARRSTHTDSAERHRRNSRHPSAFPCRQAPKRGSA